MATRLFNSLVAIVVENIKIRGIMVEKKGFFQRKAASKTSESGTSSGTTTMTQQVEEIGRQVISLRQRLKVAEQEKENIKLEFDALKHGHLKEAATLLEKKRAEFEKKLAEQGTKCEQDIASLSQKLETKNERLKAVEAALESEKAQVTKLTQELETALSTKASEVKALTKEKLEIKSQVSGALLELQEHFDYKTALLETERELLAQEKEKQETLTLQNLEACEAIMRKTEDEAGQIIDTAKATAQATAQQIISDAQAEIAEKEAQSREELDRLKGRIDHYSTQINAAAQTIDTLLGTISSL